MLVSLLRTPAHLVIDALTRTSYDVAAVEYVKCRYNSRASVNVYMNHQNEKKQCLDFI